MLALQQNRNLGVRHHPIVQQQSVELHFSGRPAARESDTLDSIRANGFKILYIPINRCPAAANFPLHGQSLHEVFYSKKGFGQIRQRSDGIGKRSGIEHSFDGGPGLDETSGSQKEQGTATRQNGISRRYDTVRLQQYIGCSGGHHPRQCPPGNRDRSLSSTGGDENLLPPDLTSVSFDNKTDNKIRFYLQLPDRSPGQIVYRRLTKRLHQVFSGLVIGSENVHHIRSDPLDASIHLAAG